MSNQSFEDIYKSVQDLEAGSTATFNGFPMMVDSCTTTYNRFYGEMLCLKQLDGTLNIDVTLKVGINFDSKSASQASRLEKENTELKAEVERLNAKLGRLLGEERNWVLVRPEEYERMMKRLKNAPTEDDINRGNYNP